MTFLYSIGTVLDAGDIVVSKAGVVTARTKLAIEWEPLKNRYYNIES